MSVPNTFASATSAIPLANLDADFAYYDAAFQIVGTAMEVNYTFRLEDPTDVTKKAEFVMSGITTGTTRQYTMPNASGTLATLANTSQTFLGTTAFVPSTNSGTITIGGISQTGTVTLGRSTASQTIDIAVGATAAASTKTVNIGAAGVSTSITNINYGSSVTGALVTQTWSAGANNMRFDSSGNLGIGTSSPSRPLVIAKDSGAIIELYSNYSSSVNGLYGKQSEGTIASPTASLANSWNLQILGHAYGTSAYQKTSEIKFWCAEAVTNSTSAGYITFSTTPTGSVTPAERMRLDSSGNLGLGGGAISGWANSRVIQTDPTFSAISTDTASDGNFSLSWNAYATAADTWKYRNTGIAANRYRIAQGSYQWFTAPSGTAGAAITFTQAMTLDASGNLVIGDTSTSSGLTLVRSGSTTAELKLNQTGTGGRDYRIGSTGSGYGTAGKLIFYDATAGAERMCIDASGNLLVGTTSSNGNLAKGVQIASTNWGLAVTTSGAAGSGTCAAFGRGTDGNVAQFYYSTALTGLIGSISVTATATAYNTSSDYRLKNITGPITTSGAYIDSLKPVEGTWKADGSTFVGLIAHETQEVSRTTVATGTKDGEEMQGMDYSSAEIIANLIAELQSLRARVASLESK